jgi:hypothetical protein
MAVSSATSGAMLLRNASSQWLEKSSHGYCATTVTGEGDCERGIKGSWWLPDDASRAWRPAAAWCNFQCAKCNRCRFISVSLLGHDCSWYWNCDHLHAGGDFRSGRAVDLSAASLLFKEVQRQRRQDGKEDASAVWPMVGDGELNELEIREHSAELQALAVRHLLRRSLNASSPGTCAITPQSDEGDCEAGDRGAWRLAPCEARSWHSALAFCLLHCARCERCAYVSVSPAAQDCSWFAAHTCHLDRLHLQQPAHGFRTLAADYRGDLLERLPRTRAAAYRVHLPAPLTTASVPLATLEGHHLPVRLQRAGEAAPVADATHCSWPTATQLPALSSSRTRSLDSEGSSSRCSAAAIHHQRAWLVLGVFSGLGASSRRAGARKTWWRWSEVADAQPATACFVLARAGAVAKELSAAKAESKAWGDIVWLANATEGCSGCSSTKLFEWWRWAAALPPTVTHVAKTEDDAVVHVPNLLADVALWRGHEHLYYGVFAWAGLRPRRPGAMCGFSWNGGHRKARSSCRPAAPFATGPLELLSVPLARFIATDAAVRAYVDHAFEYASGGRTDEDVVLGNWVAHAAARGATVVWANLGQPGQRARVHDLHCDPSARGMYQTPRTTSIAIHRVYTPRQLRYVWAVLRHCKHLPDEPTYSKSECARETHHPPPETDTPELFQPIVAWR